MHKKPYDPEIFNLILSEEQRQQETINLIASENYSDNAIRQAIGSVLTDKYAEGIVGKRYYAGCEFVDQIELIAIERIKKLFGAEHANVQPHSGSQANQAVYFAALKPGDRIMGMSLSSGGHLTHGHHINFSGTYYQSIPYTVDKETELLDYNAIEQQALTHKPTLIVAGASAYSRTIDFERFATIAQKVNALLLVDMAHIAGLVAAGLHPNPVPFADFVTGTTHKTLRGPRGGFILCKNRYASMIDKAVMPGIQGGPFMNVIAAKAIAFAAAMEPDFISYQRTVIHNAQTMAQEFAALGYRIVAGGTDTHLFTVDLRSKNITGVAAEHALTKAGITVSRSTIPFDTQSPAICSGIRIGTPAITTRGAQESDVQEIAHFIHKTVTNPTDEAAIKIVREKVAQWCAALKK